jgi:thiamine biosynthesis protein ThiS
MTISLNGEPADARGARTVADLVRVLELPAQAVLIEHNGMALHRAEWKEKQLSDGDKIEFIRVVAGG